VFVVGQGVDLLRAQRRREVVGDVLVGLVAGDLDLFDVAGDREDGVALLLPAAADVDLGDLRRLEADRLDLDDVLAGRQALDRRLALFVGGGGPRFAAGDRVAGDDRDGRAEDGRTGLIEHEDPDAAG